MLTKIIKLQSSALSYVAPDKLLFKGIVPHSFPVDRDIISDKSTKTVCVHPHKDPSSDASNYQIGLTNIKISSSCFCPEIPSVPCVYFHVFLRESYYTCSCY